MCKTLIFMSLLFSLTMASAQNQAKVNYVKLSQDFLYAAKTGDSTEAYADTLKNADQRLLSDQLTGDAHKLAFWLNIYNAFTQVILKKNPDQYKTRNSFFTSRQINIAGAQLSLDLIEHGILRHSKIKWSEGYLNKILPGSFEKKFRVNKLDHRIHFALNCGAKSCPPIAFYEPEKIERQLDIATKAYLKGEAEYDTAINSVKVPALMNWFRGDFGGKKGIIEVLKKNGIIPPGSIPSIRFKEYDWSLFLNNYKS